MDIDFDFIDAPYPSSPAAGVDLFYPAPYYAFWETANAESIRSSTKWLGALLAQSGPYDAVMCFSQGCYLAAAALLLHEAYGASSGAPPPFKAAIFICGGAPLLLAEDLGFSISAEAWERERASSTALAAQAHSQAILAQGAERWNGAQGKGTLSEDGVQKEMKGPYEIGIPTVHIYGAKDPRYVAGVQLSGLSDARKRKTFDHSGGHEIPRNQAVSKKIAGLVRWVLGEAGLSG